MHFVRLMLWITINICFCVLSNGRRRLKGSKERRMSNVVLDVNVLLGSTIMIGRTCTFDQAKWANVQAYK